MVYDSIFAFIFMERQRRKYNHQRLIEFEIVGLHRDLAEFLLAHVFQK